MAHLLVKENNCIKLLNSYIDIEVLVRTIKVLVRTNLKPGMDAHTSNYRVIPMSGSPQEGLTKLSNEFGRIYNCRAYAKQLSIVTIQLNACDI